MKTRERDSSGRFLKQTTGEMFEGNAIFTDDRGYPKAMIDGVKVRIHIYVWERVNGPIPEGCVIHHRDQDKNNYDIDNLQLLTNSEHSKLHAELRRMKHEVQDIIPIRRVLDRRPFFEKQQAAMY